MTAASLSRAKSIGLIVLAILTLGVFKSVYRRLGFPFRQLFLLSLTTGYSFLGAVALLCLVAHELQVVAAHFEELGPLLRAPELGIALFVGLFGTLWVTLWACLRWYFHELTLWERAERARASASGLVSGWLSGLRSLKRAA